MHSWDQIPYQVHERSYAIEVANAFSSKSNNTPSEKSEKTKKVVSDCKTAA
jgi:hypothetical protein